VKDFLRRPGSRWAALSKRAKAARVALLLLSVGVLLGVAFTGYVYAMWRSAPDLSELEQRDNGENSTLYSDDGERLGVIQSETLRTPLEPDEAPSLVKQATVAIEDQRFYEHEGLDFQAILRAAVENLRSGAVVEGGSTITQQVVKNLYISDDQTLGRKIREAKLASTMSERRSKEEILTLYLDNVPYGTVNGQSAIGIKAGARTFFGKPVADLKLHEAALLAGLPRSPATYDPFENPEAARERRNQVIEALAETGKISPKRARTAAAKPLGVERGSFYTKQKERYFFEYVKQQLIDGYGKERVETGGLDVYSTVDTDLQEKAREAIDSTLDRGGDPSAATVSMDPENGQIKAMVTSERFSRDSFNYATQSRRQPGSAFKPVVLMTALRQGVDPQETTYKSKPLDLDTEQYGEIDVETYDERYFGDVDLVRATLESDNTVFQQLALDLGLPKIVDNAHRLGIESDLDRRPALALGGLERGVSPLEMSRAYATMASGGVRTEPLAIRRVEFPDGEEDELADPERERAYDANVAAEATDILQENVRRGTAVKAQIGCPAAAKTGTTDDFKDAWLVGYTPALSTAVWVGYSEPKPMRDVHGIAVSGSTFPAQIWGDYMQAATGGNCEEFADPPGDADLEPFCAQYATTPECDRERADGQESDRERRRREREEAERQREQQEAERQREREQSRESGEESDNQRSRDRGGGGSGRDGEIDESERRRPPDTRIDSRPSETTSDRSPRFTFSSANGRARRFECRLDGGEYRTCESPKRYSGLDRGEHTFQVRAVGSNGRRDSSPASYTWTIRPRNSGGD